MNLVKKKKISISITPDEFLALKLLAFMFDRKSVSDSIRLCLEHFITYNFRCSSIDSFLATYLSEFDSVFVIEYKEGDEI